ncbi:MAG: flippase-like domain-containing protein [Candidatus Altiarchaeota archaeon]
MYKKRFILFFISVMLLGMLFFSLDYNEFLREASKISPQAAAGLIIVQLGIMVLMALKWFVIIRRYGVSFMNVLHTSFIGAMVNNLTPASILGGETIKAYAISKTDKIKMETAFATVFVDIFITLFPIFVLTLLAIILALSYSFDYRITLTLIAVGLFTLVLVYASVSVLMNRKPSMYLFKGIVKALKRVPFLRNQITGVESRVDEIFLSFHRSIRDTMTDKWTLYLSIFVSSWVWILSIVRIYLLLHALGIPMSFGQVTIIYTIMIAVSILPILPGALGIWEIIGTGLLTFLGVPMAAAAAVVVFDRILSYWLPIFLGFLSSLVVGINVMKLVDEHA